MTTIRLGSMQGLPERKQGVQIFLDKDGKEYASIPHHYEWGFNKAKELYDSLNLSLDVEEMAKILYESDIKLLTASGQRDYVPWADLLESMTKNHWRMLAQSLSDNIGKVLRVQPTERK